MLPAACRYRRCLGARHQPPENHTTRLILHQALRQLIHTRHLYLLSLACTLLRPIFLRFVDLRPLTTHDSMIHEAALDRLLTDITLRHLRLKDTARRSRTMLDTHQRLQILQESLAACRLARHQVSTNRSAISHDLPNLGERLLTTMDTVGAMNTSGRAMNTV